MLSLPHPSYGWTPRIGSTVCDTACTPADRHPDARSLLEGGPDEYIARRDALAKDLKAAGDRDAASVVKSLGKPTMGLWGVLAAGADADAVRSAVDATAALVRVQAGAHDRAEISSATATRRAAIDRVVALGAAALGRGSDARTQEVRDLVERLSRQPELLDAWLDGTLRDVPDEGLGFDAFAAFEPPGRATTTPERPAKRVIAATRPAVADEHGEPQSAPAPPSTARQERAARAAEREALEQQRAEREAARARRVAAKAELLAAEKASASANRQLDIARRAKEEADRVFDKATAAAAAADERVSAARDAAS
jgi:hypothetical protein